MADILITAMRDINSNSGNINSHSANINGDSNCKTKINSGVIICSSGNINRNSGN